MAQPFVVPEGVVFLIEEDGVTIENQGDVVLHTDFGGRVLKRIVSREGSIALHTAARAGRLEAGGTITVAGALEADSVSAGGELSVGGDAQVGDATAAGVRTAGALRATSLASGGGVDVGGSLTADRVSAGADIQCQGAKVSTLSAGGNLTVGGDAELGALTIGGNATFTGNVSGTTIRADVIEIGGGVVSARGIQGRTRVVIGAARLTVDAVIAPTVQLDPRTNGRVTVVESANEVGPSAIKGGFRLADYAEMFGDAGAFLAERGLTALGDAAEAPAAPPAPVAVAVEPDPEPEPAAEPEPEPAAAEAEPTAEPEPEPAAADPGEETGDPESIEAGEADAEAEAEAEAAQAESSGPAMVSIPQYSAPTEAEPAAEPVVEPMTVEPVVEAPPEPIEPAPAGDPAAGAVEHPMHAQLVSTIQRIVDCYVNVELPGAVDRLRAMADAHQYAEIRADITNIWSDLLKYHQKKGIRIHPMVTTTFNSVNSLVKKM